MYFLSAVIDNDRTAVALYNKEYKLLLKKDGNASDLASLC